MDEQATGCYRCGHRRHEGDCTLCFCQQADPTLAREAVVQARRDEMKQALVPEPWLCARCGREHTWYCPAVDA